jgi:hypothetical protein
MPELTTLKRVVLGRHHLQPGRTRHTISDTNGIREFPKFVALEIAGYANAESCYLFHICENGQVADTWHQTIEDAIHQAEYEFGVQREEWVDMNGCTPKPDR